MLDSYFQFRNSDKEYELDLARDRDWSSTKRRVLIVLQTVPSISLKEKLLTAGYVHDTLVNCIKTSRRMARAIKPIPDFSFAVVNFNNFPHFKLGGSAKAEAEATFASRINRIIKKLKPTHVFISGDQAAVHLLEEPNVEMKRGWVFQKGGIKYCSTFDLDRGLGKNFSTADLLGFWCRHLSHLLLGKHPFSLKDQLAKPKYVGSVKAFDKLMDRIDALGAKDQIAVDTETLNLSANHNSIYTIQFCLSTDPAVGFVLPLHHPKTPFNSTELRYISKRLRKFFSREKNLPTLITFNGSFDLMVIRSQFKLPIIYHPVYEIRAGEHLLDENIGTLKSVGPPMGGLAAIYAMYENDFYFTAAFSKAERATTGLVAPDNPDFLKYGARDVVSIMGIRAQQLKRAEIEPFKGNYRPWFEAHMRHIMGATTHTISHLQADGSYISRVYLRQMLAPDSALRQEIKKQEIKLRKLPEAAEANKRILEASGMKAGSLWGNENSQWVLKLSKTAHKQVLFFDVLGLPPVSETKTGQPAVDQEFIDAYADKHPAVSVLGEWSKRQKLLSTYGKGWLRRISKDIDSREDGRIRASYSFFQVVTGRLGSWDPNLQNIPSRGNLSKIIKAMFTTTPGKLLIRFDYSAHEVRMWAIAAADEALANSFLVGLNLRQQLIKALDDAIVAEIKTQLKTKGDIHVQNVHRFFGKWVTKDDPLRYAIKAVVFGVLYGKGARSLGEDCGPYATAKRELKQLRKKRRSSTDTAERDKLLKQIKKLRKFIHSASPADQEKEDTRYAQDIIDKMFAEFSKGGAWTNKMKELAQNEHYAYSPFGRKRRMWAALTGVRSVIAAGVRQGSNAPIQGYSSESGVRSSRDVAKAYYKAMPELAAELGYATDAKSLRRLWVEFNRIVHDALYHAVPYEMVLPFLHVLQWHSTFGLAAALGEEFNIDFPVPPEIEIEIGAQDTTTETWDWTMPGLARIIDKTVCNAAAMELLDRPVNDVMLAIYKPYLSDKVRNILQDRWPLLNVPDLEEPIRNMHKKYLLTLKEQPEEHSRYKKIMKVLNGYRPDPT